MIARIGVTAPMTVLARKEVLGLNEVLACERDAGLNDIIFGSVWRAASMNGERHGGLHGITLELRGEQERERRAGCWIDESNEMLLLDGEGDDGRYRRFVPFSRVDRTYVLGWNEVLHCGRVAGLNDMMLFLAGERDGQRYTTSVPLSRGGCTHSAQTSLPIPSFNTTMT